MSRDGIWKLNRPRNFLPVPRGQPEAELEDGKTQDGDCTVAVI